MFRFAALSQLRRNLGSTSAVKRVTSGIWARTQNPALAEDISALTSSAALKNQSLRSANTVAVAQPRRVELDEERTRVVKESVCNIVKFLTIPSKFFEFTTKVFKKGNEKGERTRMKSLSGFVAGDYIVSVAHGFVDELANGSNLFLVRQVVLTSVGKVSCNVVVKPVAIDTVHDLALFKLPPDLVGVKYGQGFLFSHETNIGDSLVTIGHPPSLSYAALFGSVIRSKVLYLESGIPVLNSAIPPLRDFYTIASDLCLAPGLSGSPALDTSCRVLGVNQSASKISQIARTVPSCEVIKLIEWAEANTTQSVFVRGDHYIAQPEVSSDLDGEFKKFLEEKHKDAEGYE